MHPLADFLRLTLSRPFLSCGALSAVIATRVALIVVPYNLLRKFSSPSRPLTRKAAPNPLRRSSIVKSIQITSRLIPGATCLTQALAAQTLLRLCGDFVELCLGVARSSQGHFAAHAWLEADGCIIIGDLPDLDRYRRLEPVR